MINDDGLKNTLEPHKINHSHFTRLHKHLGAMDPNFKFLLGEIKTV